MRNNLRLCRDCSIIKSFLFSIIFRVVDLPSQMYQMEVDAGHSSEKERH